MNCDQKVTIYILILICGVLLHCYSCLTLEKKQNRIHVCKIFINIKIYMHIFYDESWEKFFEDHINHFEPENKREVRNGKEYDN